MNYQIEPITTQNSKEKHWVLYRHGEFNNPVAIISDYLLRQSYTNPFIVPVPDNEQIAFIVSETRKRRGLNGHQAAGELGISRNYLGQIERAEANISLDIYRNIAKWVA